MSVLHIPVMMGEVLEMLSPKNGETYVDATLGMGGHSEGILRRAPECTLIGIDRDESALDEAKKRLEGYRNIHFVRGSFSNMKQVVNDLGYERVNGILIDGGVSTFHLKAEGRGFSFLSDEHLDMRMDRRQDLDAQKVVNSYP